MALIKLSDGCCVNTKPIASVTVSVTVNDSSETITVRMDDGMGHCVMADYGKGIYATMDKLVAEINKADDNE